MVHARAAWDYTVKELASAYKSGVTFIKKAATYVADKARQIGSKLEEIGSKMISGVVSLAEGAWDMVKKAAKFVGNLVRRHECWNTCWPPIAYTIAAQKHKHRYVTHLPDFLTQLSRMLCAALARLQPSSSTMLGAHV